jgi:hypothetical protein
MKSQFKSNNFIAIIIALMLFAVGFLLLFIHQQSESSQSGGRVKTASQADFLPAYDGSLVHISPNQTARIKIKADLAA